jgi:hypothetical protein
VSEMTWEQKLMALQVLTDTSVRMRKPGDWYVSAVGRDIGGDGFLRGVYGNGKTPQGAVEDDWRQLVVALPADRYVHIERSGVKKKFRWNDFMWKEVDL